MYSEPLELWHLHRPQSRDIGTPLRHRYIPYSYMDPLGYMYIYSSVCVYMYTHLYIYIYTYVYIYIADFTYVCAYVHAQSNAFYIHVNPSI